MLTNQWRLKGGMVDHHVDHAARQQATFVKPLAVGALLDVIKQE